MISTPTGQSITNCEAPDEPTPSLVELYGSSTQECGVDRGAESSDTSSLNERLGIFLREKGLRRVIVPSRFVG